MTYNVLSGTLNLNQSINHRQCYDMLFFLTKCQLLREFSAINCSAPTTADRQCTFQLFHVFKSLFSHLSDQFFLRNSLHRRLLTIMLLTLKNLIAALSLPVKTILVCRHNDVTFIDVELHGKGSTGCENSDSTLCSIIFCSGLEIFVYINRILTKLCRQKLGLP